MKKNAIIINLLRATFVVLAYREVAHPKGIIIPPGTGRTTAYYLKSCYHIGKSYLKTFRQRLPKA
ncbi:MAG TPA: hypothetical protein PL009_11680 [Flavipsychrobacter sp.]|nr:hypothetical protein [Flavipsychrobacter sp.]